MHCAEVTNKVTILWELSLHGHPQNRPSAMEPATLPLLGHTVGGARNLGWGCPGFWVTSRSIFTAQTRFPHGAREDGHTCSGLIAWLLGRWHEVKGMEADSGGLPQHVRRSLSKVETPVWMSASLGMVAGCAKVFQELRCVNTVNVILDA